jgi:ankyrin repeat protein
LKHPQYLEWLDPQKHAHHGFLWIRGKPGAGKSTIMKFIYRKMKTKRSRGRAVTASFFFHSRGEDLEKSIPGMYRSLLLQLLEGYPDLQEVLDDTDLVPQGQLGCPQLNVLKDLFHNAVSNLGQRTFICFIDALDECDEQQVMEMVRYFEELAESCASTGVQLRICFSSRHYPYIRIRHGIELTLEHQQGHSDDMSNYIQSNLRITSTALVEELRPQMIEKAAGVFLWVVLVVDILNKENRRGRLALRKRLAEVPSGLSELFKDILRRDANNMEDLLLCILWILCAKRPLRPEEYYHALWSGLALKDLVDPEMPNVTASDSTECVESYVITSSKGLVEITKAKSSTVQFIHESVRDFLVKDRGLQELWPDLGFDWQSLGHERLKQCCSMYLNSEPVRACFGSIGPKTQPNDLLEVSQHYPFLEYASQYVLYHSDAAAQAIPQAEFLSQTSTADWADILNFFEKFKIRQYSSKASLIYILADKGFSALIRTWLQDNPSIDIRGERYESPLFAALANGHKDAVAALLNLPLSICEGVETVEGFGSKTSFVGYTGRTPLTWAAQEGQIAILRILLQKGTNIDENDLQDYTPLMRASKAGHHAVVAFLIKEGVEVENSYAHKAMSLAFRNGHAATLKLLTKANVHWDPNVEGWQEALRTASARGNEEMVKFLIEEGVDVKIRHPILVGDSDLSLALQNGHTATSRILFEANADRDLDPETLRRALRSASTTGNEEMVKLMIEKEVEINAQDSSGYTALSLASGGGHLAIVKLLIESGAQINPDAKRSNPKPALIEATSSHHVEVLRLLLERGANIETRDEDGRTPLIAASIRGREKSASLLIEQGADVNAQDKDGKSPLHRTLECDGRFQNRGYYTNLLLRNGAIVDARDFSGQTPLLNACRYGQRGPQRFLIERGADVNARDKEGNTPLFWACYFGEPEGEPLLLIEKGADVNAKTEQGKTPLHKVCESYWPGASEELVRVLIDNGADIHARDSEGSTPLHLAVIRGHYRVVKLLVERGANVDDRNREGDTPESLAKKKALQAGDPVMLALKGL